MPGPAPSGGGSNSGGQPFGLGDPVVRQAIQTAVSVGAAIAFGSLLSGRRWYRAAIAAFVVGLNVGSRGEGVIKALQRLAGTLAGIGVGLHGASQLSGNTYLLLALVLVCIFLAFYAFQAAYGRCSMRCSVCSPPNC